jgi:sugar O-acyltransferase (sialic acid O-acetyltransferase NeuD family)
VVLDTAVAAGCTLRGFIDETRTVGEDINSLSVIGGDRLLDDRSFLAEHLFVVAIGDQEARRRLSLGICARGGQLARVQHPACVISRSALIGDGTVVIAGTIVNANARVGRFCILNTGCSVDHDSVLGDGVQICPGANLAGWVRCEDDVFVGTGAAIIPGISIGTGATVGAGAIVIRNVAAGDFVAGNPARTIPRRRQRP